MISTCPIYLDECNALRSNDSILINQQDTIITNLSTHNAILIQMDKDNKVELKKRRKNVFKYSIISFGIGFILSIFAL